jgi:hypothetical protein
LILKFAEDGTGRFMDIFINEEHHVVENLNIESMIGLYMAYDKYITFSVFNDQLVWNNEKSTIYGNSIKLRLSARNTRNAQISAIVLKKTDTLSDPVLYALNFQLILLQKTYDQIKKNSNLSLTGTFHSSSD